MGNFDLFRIYRAVWVLDFEFCAPEGENPSPVCMVAEEIKTGQVLRLWRDQLSKSPFNLGPDSLFVAFYASAEWNCFLALGWPLPSRCLDLYAEFRNRTNNLITPAGNGLLGALTYFNLPGITSDEKTDMRKLILSSGHWSKAEQVAILAYCETDIIATVRLLSAMAPKLDLPRALLRGRYTQAVARMETLGTPIDTQTLHDLRANWQRIQTQLIAEIDKNYGVYEGTTFKLKRWEKWLIQNNIPWPRLPSGSLAMDDSTFREMARSHPKVAPIRELRATLGQMRLSSLSVGQDGWNRCLLSPFSSTTGRNQPSNSRFIFGPSAWLRSLIKPPKGYGLAYVDWSQQEFGIAAALSKDPCMQEAYLSGDPYLAFAKQAGAVPKTATKVTHKAERDRFKACVLAVQYGMQEHSLASRIGQQPIYARQLLHQHQRTYRKFWAWSDAVEHHALLLGELHTVFGWSCHYGNLTKKVNPRSIRNFPMQGNGAEMLRLACMEATEAGIGICCPIHDAVLILAPLERLDRDIKLMQVIMEQASRDVLGGFALRSDAEVVHYPERYRDARGQVMWGTVQKLIYGHSKPNSYRYRVQPMRGFYGTRLAPVLV